MTGRSFRAKTGRLPPGEDGPFPSDRGRYFLITQSMMALIRRLRARPSAVEL